MSVAHAANMLTQVAFMRRRLEEDISSSL